MSDNNKENTDYIIQLVFNEFIDRFGECVHLEGEICDLLWNVKM